MIFPIVLPNSYPAHLPRAAPVAAIGVSNAGPDPARLRTLANSAPHLVRK